jgi:hypothetical protein
VDGPFVRSRRVRHQCIAAALSCLSATADIWSAATQPIPTNYKLGQHDETSPTLRTFSLFLPGPTATTVPLGVASSVTMLRAATR